MIVNYIRKDGHGNMVTKFSDILGNRSFMTYIRAGKKYIVNIL